MKKKQVQHSVCLRILGAFCTIIFVGLIFLSSQTSFSQDLLIEIGNNTACQGVPCGGLSQKILINEFMVSPAVNDGSISGPGPNGGRGEWVELYNPDACNPADISCFILGNYTSEGSGGIRIPPNTLVPPSGFAVIRGVNSPAVPFNALVANGGNVVDITISSEITVPEVCVVGNPANRFWFPNSGGWFAIYDENGIAQDAVRWGTANVTSLAVSPCVPISVGCPNPVMLPSYNDIPLSRKSWASLTNGNSHIGQSIRRLTDGSIWNGFGLPTFSTCNGVCYSIAALTCTGTATVISAPGAPPYSYAWNDPLNQTTPHAIGLCEDSYTVTITSGDGIVTTSSVNVVSHVPELTFNNATYCLNSGIQNLSGYSPIPTSGQTFSFSGPGISSTQFNPGNAGIGNKTITYSLTDQSGCTNSIQSVFTVHPVPAVSLNVPSSVCITDPLINIVSSPVGGTLIGPGIFGSTFNPSLAGAGSHEIQFTYTDPNGCTNPETTVLTTTITVNGLTPPEFAASPSYCAGDPIPNFPSTSLNNISGSWSPAINNQQTTTYTFTPSPNQCASETSRTIQINPIINPIFAVSGPFCDGAAIPALPTTSLNGVPGTWSPVINNSQTTTYTFMPNSGNCAISTSSTIVVQPILIPTFDVLGPYCAGVNVPNIPTTSQNNVLGSWLPAINNSQTTTYTFSPAPSECAVAASMQIVVVSGAISLSCPQTSNLSCFSEMSNPILDFTGFLNNGGSISSNDALLVSNTFSMLSETGAAQSCNALVTRVYEFENICGQSASCSEMILINDTISPTGLAPNDTLVQCIADLPLPNIGALSSVADNCSTPMIFHVSDQSTGSCPEIVLRTYRIQDACGNFVDVTQTITVFDTIPPTGTAPANEFVQCINDVPNPNANGVQNVADNCSTPVTTHLGDVSNNQTCPEIILRTYRIEDACGNFTDLIQTITVWDTIAPSGTAPQNITVDCIGDVPQPNTMSVSNTFDNCTIPTVMHLSDSSTGTCPEIITRTYRVEDACGNFTDLIQLIAVLDSIPPTGTAPPNIIVSCPSEIPAPNSSDVTNVSDNCQVAIVTHYSDVSDGNFCNSEVITRTYRIEDACGNETFVSHLITVDLFTPTASLATSNPTTCLGSEGFITVSGLYANTNYVITYNNELVEHQANAQGQIQIGNLNQGSYSNFLVTYSACGFCAQIINETQILTDPPNPIVNAGVDVAFCDGNQYYIVAGNPQDAQITWLDNIQNGSLIQPAVGINVYSVTAMLNNCFSTDQVTVTVYPLPQVDAGADLTVCAGTPIILSGIGAQDYFWTNNVVDGEPFFQVVSYQSYQLTGVDQFGCFNQDEVQITLLENPIPSFSQDVFSSCEIPFTVTLSNSSSLDAVDCSWSFGNNTTVLGACNGVEAIFENVGCYGASLTVAYMNGCVNTVYYDSIACVLPSPTAEFFATPSVQEVNSDIFFFNTSQNAMNYFWHFNDDGPAIQDKDVIFQYEESGTYEVVLIAVNEYGCVDSAKQLIGVSNPILLFVPNAFTPDGDAYNNDFKPVMATGFDPWNYELTIFNRSGEILFVSRNANFGWPGTYGGKMVPEGVYIWQIQVKGEKGINEIHRGHVSLLK